MANEVISGRRDVCLHWRLPPVQKRMGLIAGFVHLLLVQSVHQGRHTVNVHFKFYVQLQFVNYFCM